MLNILNIIDENIIEIENRKGNFIQKFLKFIKNPVANNAKIEKR